MILLYVKKDISFITTFCKLIEIYDRQTENF